MYFMFVSHKDICFLRCVGVILHSVFVFRSTPAGRKPRRRMGEKRRKGEFTEVSNRKQSYDSAMQKRSIMEVTTLD